MSRIRPCRTPTKAFRELTLVPCNETDETTKIGRPKRKKRKRASPKSRKQRRKNK